MNLLFFDIECASVFKNVAKICAFGYVLCDEQFNIIEKEDILVNPKGRFHLTDGRGEKGLVLPYEYSEFKNYPPFPMVYPRIKALLEDQNNLVFGHSTMNDVKYLDLETGRYKLPPFNFRFSDSQLMYMASISDYSRQFGLEYITKDLNVDFVPHRAADDAYATMKIVEAMCKREGLSVYELEKKLGIKYGKIKNRQIIRPTCRGFIQYCNDREKAKREKAKARSQFYIFVSRRKPKKSGKYYGKTFCFSKELEYGVKTSTELIAMIYDNGGVYSSKPEESDYYICEENDATARTVNAKNKENIQIIDINTLREMCNGVTL